MRAVLLPIAWLAMLAPGTTLAQQLQATGATEIVSDYRYRGVSLSNSKPAIQASAELESAGFTLAGFGSWIPRGGSAGGVELDAGAGYRATLSQRLTLDAGVSWYLYPGARDCDYAEARVAIGWDRGDTSARVGAAYAPRQANLIDSAGNRADELYGFAEIESAIPGTPFDAAFAVGYESGAFDGAARGGKVDWRAGLTATHERLYLAIAYTGAWRPRSPAAERRTERGTVLTLGRAF